MIFGVIVAGGTGSRMGASMPKQFLDLAGTPIIVHTLRRFLMCAQFDHIYIGVHPEWVAYMLDLVEKFIPSGQRKQVTLVAGGAERNDTIMNVISQIEKDFGECDEHYIITQDGVRPFVSLDLIEKHIECVKQYDAVDTAIQAVDTIIVSEDGRWVGDIPERRRMFQSQTPQSFRMSLLKNLYNGLNENEKNILTDACKICTVREIPVYIVEGEVSNMKITTTVDYAIAQLMAEKLK